MGAALKILLLPAEFQCLAQALAPEKSSWRIPFDHSELLNFTPRNSTVVAVANTQAELEELKDLVRSYSLPLRSILASETGRSLNEWTEDGKAVGALLEKLDKLLGRSSQKSRLLQIIETLDLFLFHDQHGTAYVRFDAGGHLQHWPVSSTHFKRWLQRQYYEVFGEAVNRDALTAALGVLEGKALFEGPEHHLEVRTCWHGEALWIDLCDSGWRAIKVTEEGWEVVEEPPILFRRYPHQASLPLPEEGGSVEDFLSFLNLQDSYGELLQVWLVTAFIPNIPRPVITAHGPQGSGKSTLGRLLKSLIDPSRVELHRLPRDENELVQALSHHALMIFDNLDGLPPWASDCLCRAVTGGGHQKRRLYTDDEDVIYSFQRALILNGINLPSARPDLLDRSILIHLDRIPWEMRRTEEELWAEFEAIKPWLFGAVLNTLSKALAVKPNVELKVLPRMADWALWGYAVAEALGIGGSRFLKIYGESIRSQNEEVLAGHPVAQALLSFMEGRERWEGSASELYKCLEQEAEKLKVAHSRAWPKAPNSLSRKLNTLRTNLEEAGIFITITHSTDRKITITTQVRDKNRPNRLTVLSQENHRDNSDGIETDTVLKEQYRPNTVLAKSLKNKRSDDKDGSDDISATLVGGSGDGGTQNRRGGGHPSPPPPKRRKNRGGKVSWHL